MFSKKAMSNVTIIAIIVIVVLGIIFLLLAKSFSQEVEKTDESSSVYTCKLAGTTNKCCLPSDDNVIPANKGKWKDCQEPETACCVG